MKKIDLGQTINTLANLGVLAGIVFLAIEVSQNEVSIEEQSRLTFLTGRDAATEHFNGFRTLLLENPDLMQIWNTGRADGDLAQLEVERFQLLCQNYLWSGATLFTRYRGLGIDEEIPSTVGPIRGAIRGSTRFRECWEDWSSFNSRFTEFIGLIEAD